MIDVSSPVVALTLWVLLAFSVTTWTLIAVKGRLQWRLAQLNRAFRTAFWAAPDLSQAEHVARQADGPLARVGLTGFVALRELESAPEGLRSAQEALEARLRQQVQQEQDRLESGLMVLASIGSTAPFVGLFGTVWGIMHALEDISRAGTASLDIVAGPIGEALVATAIGIATAIPAVLAYNYGVRRVRLYVAEFEEFASEFMRAAARVRFSLGAGG